MENFRERTEEAPLGYRSAVDLEQEQEAQRDLENRETEREQVVTNLASYVRT